MLNNLTFAYVYLTTMMKREEGQGMAEYALILVLISIAAIVTMGLLGGTIDGVFGQIDTALQ